MPKNVGRALESDRNSNALVWAICAILALTAYRIVLLSFADADIDMDEAQYWLWGQELAFGYYSKPPLIGWIIRLSTEIGGHAPFWLRLPAPILHCLTAFAVIGAARQITDIKTAAICGFAYLTLPAAALGSILISTDTVMLPFFAAALWLYLSLTKQPSIWRAALMGACLGAGMMGKYAAVYFLLCAAIAMLFLPQFRIRWQEVLVALICFGLVISPNVFWNLQNDLTTLSHTADNIDWVKQEGSRLNFANMAEFFFSQFAVMGPGLFAGYLVACVVALRSGPSWMRFLVVMSLPILLLVVVQALLSRAYANWAVATYVAGTILAMSFLWLRWRTLAWGALAINLALSLALPVVATQVSSWEGDDNYVLKRYVGRDELSHQIMDEARALGTTAIVSPHRNILADLFYTGFESDLNFHGVPDDGPPKHYYAQTHPLPLGGVGDVLYVVFDGPPPSCVAGNDPTFSFTAGKGDYYRRTLNGYLVPATCWDAP